MDQNNPPKYALMRKTKILALVLRIRMYRVILVVANWHLLQLPFEFVRFGMHQICAKVHFSDEFVTSS